MGASQSKKRRKEKRKRRRFSPVHEIPRSASVDVIRTMNVSPCLSSCPHCLHSLSWSDYVGVDCKNSPYRHRCLHGQYEEMRVGGAGFESCPNCYSTGQQQQQPQQHQMQPHGVLTSSFPGMASRDSASDYSTMSLNRNVHHQTSRQPGSTHAGDLEFSQFLEILECQKEKTRLLQLQSEARSQRSSVSPHKITMASLPSTSADHPSSSLSSNPQPSHPSSSSSMLSATDNQALGSRDKKIVALDDDESKVSRWIKRKQMAQQLRDLRKHLEDEQSSELPSPLLSARTNNGLGESGDAENFVRLRHQSKADADETQLTASSQANLASSDVPSSPTRRSTRSKFSRLSNYRFLDNHPVLTKLQNEQNNRLECMERRMKEIRISAMQEAERRKYAEIFPAKNDDSETQRMLEEAKESLEKLKEEKRRKAQSLLGQQANPDHQEQGVQLLPEDENRLSQGGSLTSNDSGDIIPVCVVPRKGVKSSQTKVKGVKGQCDKSKEGDKKDSKSFWLKSNWPEINLNQPLTWLLLPFLLFPLILRMLLSLIINTSTSAVCERTTRNNNSGSDDRNGRRPSDSNSGLSRLGSKKLS